MMVVPIKFDTRSREIGLARSKLNTMPLLVQCKETRNSIVPENIPPNHTDPKRYRKLTKTIITIFDRVNAYLAFTGMSSYK
mmetsp:Transcript_13561/g.34111  ORF Transcript_13561/g.34111 Transcript_13561/m.34111 type:complete len:81 (+) Transcript_13561:1348-1590(+)